MNWVQALGIAAGVGVLTAYGAVVKGASRHWLDLANAVLGPTIVASELAVGAWAALVISVSWTVLGFIGLLRHRRPHGRPGGKATGQPGEFSL